MSAAPLIPRRTSASLRRGLHNVYCAGWRRGVWQGALVGGLVLVLIVEAVRWAAA